MHYTPLSPVSFLTGQLPQIPPRTKSRLALYPYSTAPSPPRLLLVPLHRLRLEPVLLVLAGLPPPHSVRTLCTQISLLGRPWTSRDTLREFHTPDTCFTTPVRSDKSVADQRPSSGPPPPPWLIFTPQCSSNRKPHGSKGPLEMASRSLSRTSLWNFIARSSRSGGILWRIFRGDCWR